MWIFSCINFHIPLLSLWSLNKDDFWNICIEPGATVSLLRLHVLNSTVPLLRATCIEPLLKATCIGPYCAPAQAILYWTLLCPCSGYMYWTPTVSLLRATCIEPYCAPALRVTYNEPLLCHCSGLGEHGLNYLEFTLHGDSCIFNW